MDYPPMEPDYDMPSSPPTATASAEDTLGKMVPQSIEAEACVLGSMLLEASCMDLIVQLIKPEHFHRPAHEELYNVLLEMRENATASGSLKPIDLVLVRDELERRQLLEAVGGVEYLVALAEGVPSAANVEYYAGIVRDKALLRELIRAGQTILTEAYESQDEAEVVVDRAESAIMEVAQQQVRFETSELGDVMQDTIRILQEQEGQLVTGLPTGYDKLDELTSGFQESEMIILAARPSMGKTALLLNLAEYMSVTDKRPIAFFSLEMANTQVAQRLLASHAQFNLRQMRRGMIHHDEWQRIQVAAGDLEKAPFLIDDSPELTPMQLRAKARRLHSSHNIQCVMIDYLQLMTYSGRADSRQAQITEMSRSIKALARELKIPVLCAAQLNRGPADRPTHTPRMSDLRESGSIEQDADVVMLLHNEDYYHRGEEDYVPENKTQLIIAKQRNGPTGTVNLNFLAEYTRFVPAANDFVGV